VKTRPFLLLFLATALFAQSGWQTAENLPAVDLSGLTKTQRAAALAVLRSESCACGCDMKIAQCRMEDPKCGVSRRLAAYVVKEASAGKNVAAIKTALIKYASAPEMLLEDKAIAIPTAGDPIRGPQNAKVTIIEFSDFQCPYCAKAVTEVATVLKKYPTSVRLIFKQYPLDIHSQAEMAAEAALAAQAQGKFWEMHDRLYAGFPDLSRKTVFGYAKQLGLDMNRFTREVDGHKYAARVHAEEQEGEVAGVGGTPTFYINGKKYNGLFELAQVAPIIRKEISGAKN